MSIRSNLLIVTSLLFLSGAGIANAAEMPPVPDRLVVAGDHNVHMMTYELKKGCYSYATVRQMTLVYEGTSPKNIRTVYAKVNGKTITGKRSINPQNYTVTLFFNPKSPIGLCYSGDVEIYANFSNNATFGSRHRFILELQNDLVTTEGGAGIPQEGLWVEVARKK